MTKTGTDIGPGMATLALLAILCSACVTVLESMAVGVTLPAIATEFDVSAARVTWVMGASQFVIVTLLLPVAAVAAVVGYRRILLGALGLFALASAACMMAPNFATITAARAVQAVGTAGAMGLGFAMLRTIFSEAQLGMAIGLVATTVAVSSSLGPAVSGAILSVASWRAVFGLLAALSLIALSLGWAALPNTPPTASHIDLVGSAMVIVMLGALLVAINGLAAGWSGGLVAGALGCFAMILWRVLRRSQGQGAPVFPVDLFAAPVFSLSILASICAFMAQSLGFILLPFYLLYGAGMTEWQMALTLSVWPAATAMMAPVLGRFSHRIPTGPVGGVGLAVLALGFVLVAQAGPETSPIALAIRLALCGIGFALFQTPNNRLIMLSAPQERSAAASGTLSLARQVGRACGTAIAALVLLHAPTPSLSALLIAAAVAALGAVASFARSGSVAPARADEKS